MVVVTKRLLASANTSERLVSRMNREGDIMNNVQIGIMRHVKSIEKREITERI